MIRIIYKIGKQPFQGRLTAVAAVAAGIILIFSSFIFPGCRGGSQGRKPEQSIRVMTWNIRLNSPGDGVNAWPHRRGMSAELLKDLQPDIIGVQEALADQVGFLDSVLSDHIRLGVGRDDGKNAGEFMALYCRKHRFIPLEDSTFWLSETPEVPSLGWDACCRRTVTWTILGDRNTGRRILVLNTHFDHLGQTARLESAAMVLEFIKKRAGDLPVILMGDLNADQNSEVYRMITTFLKDTRTISEAPHEGPNRSFNGFDIKSLNIDAGPIDHIFISSSFRVISHTNVDRRTGERFPSDHFPVFSILEPVTETP